MKVVFSVGSNVGNRLGHLQAAVDALAERGRLRVSPVYETTPVGGPDQGDYLNAVLIADLPAGTDLLALITATEQAAGRERTQRWGPRTLDLDVVAVDDLRSADPQLTLPHPRASGRAFVLAPWLDLDAAGQLPGAGSVAGLLQDLGSGGRDGIRRRDDLTLAVR